MSGGRSDLNSLETPAASGVGLVGGNPPERGSDAWLYFGNRTEGLEPGRLIELSGGNQLDPDMPAEYGLS
jgi:hypothetical protein